MPAPNIPFEKLPAGMAAAFRDEGTGQVTYFPDEPSQPQRPDPRQYFTSQLQQKENYLKQQYRTQWEALRSKATDADKFRQDVDQLIANTKMQLNQAQYEHQQKIAVLDQIQQMQQSNLLSPEVAQQESWQQTGLNIPQQKQVDPGTEINKAIRQIKNAEASLTQAEESQWITRENGVVKIAPNLPADLVE